MWIDLHSNYLAKCLFNIGTVFNKRVKIQCKCMYKHSKYKHITGLLCQHSQGLFKSGLRVGVITLKVTPRHVLLTIFLSFYSQRVQKPLPKTLPAVFCTKLRLIPRVRLVWRFKITNFLWKKSFCTGLRVVLRPPQRIARMAPDSLSTQHNPLL